MAVTISDEGRMNMIGDINVMQISSSRPVRLRLYNRREYTLSPRRTISYKGGWQEREWHATLLDVSKDIYTLSIRGPGGYLTFEIPAYMIEHIDYASWQRDYTYLRDGDTQSFYQADIWDISAKDNGVTQYADNLVYIQKVLVRLGLSIYSAYYSANPSGSHFGICPTGGDPFLEIKMKDPFSTKDWESSRDELEIELDKQLDKGNTWAQEVQTKLSETLDLSYREKRLKINF